MSAATTQGRIVGYASLFGRVDLAGDVVERGAFARTLGAGRRGAVRMLFQHDPAEPIGVWDRVEEDGLGLRVEGRLTRGVKRADDVLSLVRDGALDGLSIGFRTKRAVADQRSGVRRILEADLWEISIVTFPMLPGARITAASAA